jgi:organic hydroperoxide reductase OsmC/OhrA
MTICASIKNNREQNEVIVTTNGNSQTINLPLKKEGLGSSVNGGELLFLSLATCFCNDLYREAVRRNIDVESVQVVVSGEFGKEGEPASNISYMVKVISPKNTQQEIDDLIEHVDKVAEVHNTLRKGVTVSLKT